MTEFKPGVYFGMPAEEYHSVPALSNSGIKWLRVSTLDYWARSFMNPDYEPEETKFTINGTACHKRVCEGAEAFHAAYDAELDLEDYPGALVSHTDLKEACKARELKVSGTKADLARRLKDDDPRLIIWEDVMAQHAASGKILLPSRQMREIEVAAKMIEAHPELSKCFSGGYPEVSIFWDHDGVPMKCRIDYLKPAAIVDYKTMSNPYGKPIDRAIATAIASERYHIQAAVYYEGVQRAKQFMLREEIHDANNELCNKWGRDFWINKFVESDQTFVFVFQQTGIAPVARGKVFPRQLTYDCGRMAMEEAIETFRKCREQFGADPWVDMSGISALDDAEFPAYIAEV